MICKLKEIITTASLLTLSVILINCSTAGKKNAAEFKDGWLNNDTYVVRAEGIIDSKVTSIEKRREQCRDAAVKNARIIISDIFYEWKNSPDGLVDESALKWRREFLNSIIKSGVVISEESGDSRNCKIEYRVSHPNLRAYVENLNGDWSDIDKKPDTADDNRFPVVKGDPDKHLVENQGAFFSEDRYLFKYRGKPGKDEKDITKRKEQAAKTALLMSQYEIINYFYAVKNIYSDPLIEYNNKLLIYKRELTAIVKAGSVISEKFDKEQNCIILYQVKSKNFRKWIASPL